MTITKITKFHGNSKYFAGLAQIDDEKYMLIYGLIGKMIVKNEITSDAEKRDQFWIPIVKEMSATVKIPFIADNGKHLFNLIPLHNKDEYDTILSLLEVIYGE